MIEVNGNALIQASTLRMEPAETVQLYRLSTVVIEYILHGWLKSPSDVPFKAHKLVRLRNLLQVNLLSNPVFNTSF